MHAYIAEYVCITSVKGNEKPTHRYSEGIGNTINRMTMFLLFY